MRDRPISRRGFLVLFAGVAAAACAPSAPPAPASSPAAAAAPTTPPGATAPAQAAGGAKPFTIVDGTEPNSLDPPVGTGPFGHPIRAIFESLVTFNARMEPVPQLATSWDSTPDLKTWTFKLRPGVKFHDGTPFNSEAVKFSIMRISDPEVLSNRRASYAMIQESQTPDPQTAVFVLNRDRAVRLQGVDPQDPDPVGPQSRLLGPEVQGVSLRLSADPRRRGPGGRSADR